MTHLYRLPIAVSSADVYVKQSFVLFHFNRGLFGLKLLVHLTNPFPSLSFFCVFIIIPSI